MLDGRFFRISKNLMDQFPWTNFPRGRFYCGPFYRGRFLRGPFFRRRYFLNPNNATASATECTAISQVLMKPRTADLFAVKIDGLKKQLTTQFFQSFSFIAQSTNVCITPHSCSAS